MNKGIRKQPLVTEYRQSRPHQQQPNPATDNDTSEWSQAQRATPQSRARLACGTPTTATTSLSEPESSSQSPPTRTQRNDGVIIYGIVARARAQNDHAAAVMQGAGPDSPPRGFCPDPPSRRRLPQWSQRRRCPARPRRRICSDGPTSPARRSRPTTPSQHETAVAAVQGAAVAARGPKQDKRSILPLPLALQRSTKHEAAVAVIQGAAETPGHLGVFSAWALGGDYRRHIG